MAKVDNLLVTLMIALVFSNIVFAVLDFSEPVHADSEMIAVGGIEVYDSDGTTRLTSFDFPLFMVGIADTFRKCFFINNTANQPVNVRWNVAASSISWQSRGGPHLELYDHYEDGILKYRFGICQDFASADYWQPKREMISLGISEGAKLQFELSYTGIHNTVHTFAIKVCFRAIGK